MVIRIFVMRLDGTSGSVSSDISRLSNTVELTVTVRRIRGVPCSFLGQET